MTPHFPSRFVKLVNILFVSHTLPPAPPARLSKPLPLPPPGSNPGSNGFFFFGRLKNPRSRALAVEANALRWLRLLLREWLRARPAPEPLGLTSEGAEAAGGCQAVMGCATALALAGGSRSGTWSVAWLGGKREAEAAALLAAARWRNCMWGGRREGGACEDAMLELA